MVIFLPAVVLITQVQRQLLLHSEQLETLRQRAGEG